MGYSRFRAVRSRHSEISQVDARDLANVREHRRWRWHLRHICDALMDMECAPVEPQGDDGQSLHGLSRGNAVGSEPWQRQQRRENLIGAIMGILIILLIIACLSMASFIIAWGLRMIWLGFTGR